MRVRYFFKRLRLNATSRERPVRTPTIKAARPGSGSCLVHGFLSFNMLPPFRAASGLL